MKKLFFVLAIGCSLTAFQSCAKCGHCVRTAASTVGGISTTNKIEDSSVCGNDANESGSYAKQAKINCERWASEQTPQTGVTYTSEWVTDK